MHTIEETLPYYWYGGVSSLSRFPAMLRIFAALFIVLLLISTVHLNTADSFGKYTLKVGAKGGDVYELQGRLSYLGYYRGKVDGDFGWITYNSVKTFQWKFGLKVDGLVGAKTKLMLWKATKNWAPTSSGSSYVAGFSQQDVTLLARTIHGEARGEPYIGKVAVAAVVLNRVRSPLFPKNISGVVFQPGAFTAVDDGQIWLTPNTESYKAARDAINGWDPSSGALYYFNPVTATSKWIWTRPQIKQIGKHIFTN